MQRAIIENRLYVTATARGVEYCLHRHGDGWGVSSRRLALGRHNTGGFKSYATLADVAQGCRAFADLDALQIAVFGFAVNAKISVA